MKRTYNRKPQHEPMREPVHQPVHEEQHAAPMPSTRLTRKNYNASNTFDINPDVIPDGMDWNWKTQTVMGEEQTRRMQSYRENHWEEVDASQVPGFMPSGYKGTVRLDGQVLMQRPKYLSDEAHREARHDAERQITRQVQNSSVEGDDEGPRTRPQLSRSIEAG